MTRPIRVLFLEDQPAEVELMVLELRHAGYTPTFARVETPEDLMAALDQPGWELIISDYTMPRLSAPAALRLLKQRGVDLPFIVVSGTRSEGALLSVMQEGAADYLLKDRLARLGPAIGLALEQKRLRDEKSHVEAALRESEERFRIMADHAPVLIWVSGLDTGCSFVNKTWLDFTGRTLQQELGHGWIATLHPEDYSLWRERYVAAFASRHSFQVEYRRRRAGGEYRWVLDSGAPRFDSEGCFVGFIGSVMDITEHKRSDEALLRSEEQFAKAFRASPDALMISREADGQIVEFDDSQDGLLGYDRGELVGRDAAGLNLFAHPADFERAMGQLETQGHIRDFELEIRRKSGELRHASLSAERIIIHGEPCFLTNLRDITSRKQAEAALRRQLAELAALHAIAVAGTEENAEYALIERATGVIGDIITADNFGAFLADEAAGVLRRHASFRVSAGHAAADSIPLSQGITGLVAATGQSWRVSDATSQPKYLSLDTGMRSVVCVPLKVRQRVIGVIEAESVHAGAFSEADERLLLTLAGQLAIAIDRLRAEAAERRHARQLATIYDVGRQAAFILEFDQLLPAIVRLIGERMNFYYVAIGVVEGDELVFRAGYQHGAAEPPAVNFRLPIGQGLAGRVAESGQKLLVPDVSRFEGYDRHALSPEAGAELAVPLRVEGQVIGVLNIGSDRAAGLTEADAALIEILADQVAAAMNNASLFNQIRAGRERLQAVSRRLVEVQELERRHLARELHDEIGQILTGLKLILEMGSRQGHQVAQSSLVEAQGLVNDLLLHVRELSLDLRPAMLDDLGLLPALLWYLERYTAHTHVHVDFKHQALERRRFGAEIETAAYRIVQEALTNVARHAGVTDVTVRVWCDQKALVVQVEDRGTGFNPQRALRAGTSSGLAGMNERAVLLGGQLIIEAAKGGGTCLTAELPLDFGSRLERRQYDRHRPARG